MDQWRQAPLLLQPRVLHYQELRSLWPLTKTPLLLTMGKLHFNLYRRTRAWWQAPLITNAATCIILPGIEESVPLQKSTFVDHGYTTIQFILMDQWLQAPLLLQQRVLHYQELRSLLPYKKTLLLTMGILHLNLYWWTSGDRCLISNTDVWIILTGIEESVPLQKKHFCWPWVYYIFNLTHMLLAAYFANLKWIPTWQGLDGLIKNLCSIVLWTKLASAL